MKENRSKTGEFSERHTRAVEALKRSEERYALAQRAANIGSWDWDIGTSELVWSEQIEPMFGFGRGEFGATYEAFLGCVHPEDRQDVVDSVNACIEQGKDYAIEHRIVWPDGTVRWVSETGDVIRDENGKAIRMVGIVQDITERKNIEARQRLAGRILESLSREVAGLEAIRDVVSLVKEFSGFEAVGIRLHEGDDFPYFETKGFSEGFVKAENYLCVRDKNGKQIYDSQGNQVLECMCGNVLSGRTDPTLPFFTGGGSFWTNSTTKLLASARPEDLQSPVRGRCNKAGYESVALIPLRSGDQVVGLLQLNDTRPGRFTIEVIRFLEETGASIGIALARVKAEEALRLHEIRLQALLDLNKMTEASEQEILGFVREEIVSITQSKFAFIGFMNEDESVQTTYAWSKEVMKQCAIVETPRQFTVAEAGLWGEAVRQRRPIIINDYAAPHPAKKGIPEGHVPIKRFLCVPVFDGERIVVVAAVANKEKDYDESDVRAFTSMMNDTWRLIRHKQAEQVLQEREDKYRAIFEQAADSIVLIDADSGDLVEFNDKAHENLGYTREEFQKLKIRDFEIIESAEEVAKHIEKIVRDGTDAFETKHRTKSGQIRDILVGSRAISIGGGDFILSIWRDITERKQAEEDLRKYRQHLEELVQDRTEELTEANRKLLQEIEERKRLEKEILNISEQEQQRIGRELHDSIGQQFTGIAFMMKVLEQKLANKMSDEATDAAEIAKLVKQAMDQTRDLAKGLHPVDLDAGSLMPALQEFAATTQNLFGICCTFKCDKPIRIDDAAVAVHLYRITQEAVTNAIKHGGAKNIQIVLTYGRDKSVLTVKNDGLDFPKEFEKRGTGMGLQIMDHRVDIIGGSLDIHKASEGGTILTCTFPNKR